MPVEHLNTGSEPFIAGISSDVVDQITEAITKSIKETESGVIELKTLMESVKAKAVFQKNIDLLWATIRVKKYLESKGIIRVTYGADRTQLISFASTNSISAGQLVTSPGPVRLVVGFTLVHEKYSDEESEYVRKLKKVLNVGYVEHFEFIRNNGRLNPYEFVVILYFRNYASFDKFLHSKPQIEFRKLHWDKEVKEHTYFGFESQENLVD